MSMWWRDKDDPDYNPTRDWDELQQADVEAMQPRRSQSLPDGFHRESEQQLAALRLQYFQLIGYTAALVLCAKRVGNLPCPPHFDHGTCPFCELRAAATEADFKLRESNAYRTRGTDLGPSA